MTGTELTEGVQFIVDQSGHVTAVVVEPALWRRILEALEDTPIRQNSGYRAASERQIALMTQGFNWGSQGTATWTRDELHER